MEAAQCTGPTLRLYLNLGFLSVHSAIGVFSLSWGMHQDVKILYCTVFNYSRIYIYSPVLYL
jgi:hypothetical protein